MSSEAALELFKLLAPAGSLAIVAGILAYRSPQLVKELFTGVGGLLLTIGKVKRGKETLTRATREDRRKASARSSNSRKKVKL